MKSRFAQWTLWAINMAIFTGLTVTAKWSWLTVAILASSIVWYGIVPRTRSRQQ